MPTPAPSRRRAHHSGRRRAHHSGRRAHHRGRRRRVPLVVTGLVFALAGGCGDGPDVPAASPAGSTDDSTQGEPPPVVDADTPTPGRDRDAGLDEETDAEIPTPGRDRGVGLDEETEAEVDELLERRDTERERACAAFAALDPGLVAAMDALDTGTLMPEDDQWLRRVFAEAVGVVDGFAGAGVHPRPFHAALDAIDVSAAAWADGEAPADEVTARLVGDLRHLRTGFVMTADDECPARVAETARERTPAPGP